jgi:hypothetical protein
MDYYSESRMKRALEQPMYLLNAEYSPKDKWYFVVQGYSGSNYDVTIDANKMECTCSDFKLREKLCKHLYFIIARVANDKCSLMHINEHTNIYKINSNFTQTLKDRLINCNEHKNNEHNDECNDDCVICFDIMNNIQQTIKCGVCKNNFHTQCLNRWLVNKPSCPLCRSSLINKTQQKNTNSLAYFNNLIINPN